MVVCLVIYGSIDTLTGGYLYDRQVVEHLRHNGHSVHLLSLLERPYPLRLSDNLNNRLIARVCEIKPDLLLQDELCHPSLFAVNRRLKTHLSLPLVSVVHHLSCEETRTCVLNAIMRWIEERYLDTVDGFVFNSQTTRHSVLQMSRSIRPHVVAPPGGDRLSGLLTKLSAQTQLARGGPLRLLYVGLVIRRKGLLPLIEALSRVPAHKWQLDVVGSLKREPRYVRQCRQKTTERGLAAHIRFWDQVGDRDLAELMAAAHLLCMPFAYEGFGITTLEALKCGVPVIGSTAGATHELVRHGSNGLLFDPDDISGVVETLEQLYVDREQLRAMSSAAYKKAQRMPSWQASMQQVEAFLVRMARN